MLPIPLGRAGIAVAIAMLAGALMLLPRSASALPLKVTEAQSVTSSEGSFAHGLALHESGVYERGQGTGWDILDGRKLSVSSFFSHPEGVIAGTSPLDDLDLTKPFGYLKLTAFTPPPGPNMFGSSEELCRSATNVTSYSTGGPTVFESSWGQVPGWGGVWFDIECDGGFGFGFIRVHYEGSQELRRVKVGADPGEAHYDPDGDHDVPIINKNGAAGSKPLGNKGPEVPTIPNTGRVEHNLGLNYNTSGFVAGDTHWGDGMAGNHQWGYLRSMPVERTGAQVSLCGHRDGEEPECWRSGRLTDGSITPTTEGMTHVTQRR